MDGDSLTVSAIADAAQVMERFDVTVEDAGQGEYFAFVATRAPTTLAGIETFDPDRDCAKSFACELSASGPTREGARSPRAEA
jgi:hypothetical protein